MTRGFISDGATLKCAESYQSTNNTGDQATMQSNKMLTMQLDKILIFCWVTAISRWHATYLCDFCMHKKHVGT
jgi:hypothetical protein